MRKLLEAIINAPFTIIFTPIAFIHIVGAIFIKQYKRVVNNWRSLPSQSVHQTKLLIDRVKKKS